MGMAIALAHQEFTAVVRALIHESPSRGRQGALEVLSHDGRCRLGFGRDVAAQDERLDDLVLS